MGVRKGGAKTKKGYKPYFIKRGIKYRTKNMVYNRENIVLTVFFNFLEGSL